MITEKKCFKCKEIKDINNFYKDKSKKDGLTVLCKICFKEKYKNEREERLIYKKKYANAHKEQINKYFKTYYKNHKKSTIKICAKCGNSFEVFKEGGKKYCSNCQFKLLQKKNDIKTCVICSMIFKSSHPNALYCEHCKIIKKKEKGRRNTATFEKKYPERVKDTKQKYYEKMVGFRPIRYCLICGSPIGKNRTILYCKDCSIKMKKINEQKHEAKRRTLAHNPINFPFPNSEGHHLDKSTVIYIPKIIHRSISHNVFTGKNMSIINGLAWKWYFENEEYA